MFFDAVDEWIAHPRHYEVTRDIGESTLKEYEYTDDLGGFRDNNSDYEDDALPEELTTSDDDFIAHLDEGHSSVEDELDRIDKAAERVLKKTRKEKSESPVKKQKFAQDMAQRPQTLRTPSKVAKSSRLHSKKSEKSVRKGPQVVQAAIFFCLCICHT